MHRPPKTIKLFVITFVSLFEKKKPVIRRATLILVKREILNQISKYFFLKIAWYRLRAEPNGAIQVYYKRGSGNGAPSRQRSLRSGGKLPIFYFFVKNPFRKKLFTLNWLDSESNLFTNNHENLKLIKLSNFEICWSHSPKSEHFSVKI